MLALVVVSIELSSRTARIFVFDIGGVGNVDKGNANTIDDVNVDESLFLTTMSRDETTKIKHSNEINLSFNVEVFLVDDLRAVIVLSVPPLQMFFEIVGNDRRFGMNLYNTCSDSIFDDSSINK